MGERRGEGEGEGGGRKVWREGEMRERGRVEEGEEGRRKRREGRGKEVKKIKEEKSVGECMEK